MKQKKSNVKISFPLQGGATLKTKKPLKHMTSYYEKTSKFAIGP